MAGFVEALSKEHLWRWLETERGCTIYGEIPISHGRIDLAGITPGGDYIGVELKANVPEYPTDYYGQLSRYLESGCFDKVYFASHDAAAFQTRLDKMDVSFSELRTAARHLNGGINAGLYTKQDVLDQMENEFSPEFLTNESASLPGFEKESPRKYVTCRLGASTSYEPVELDKGMEMIRRAQAPQDVGVIEIPIGGISTTDVGYGQTPRTPSEINDPRSALGLDQPESPTILKPATSIPRSTEPEFSDTRSREPYIRHRAWIEFTGLPEASIPNTTDSDQGHRPIDILSLRGGTDPVEILSKEGGEIIGIEAKGMSSFMLDPAEDIAKQLRDYATSGGLSRLFLSVPKKLTKNAQSLIEQKSLTDFVGLIIVCPDGTTEVVDSAPELNLRYDSYIHKGQTFRLGYDELSLPTDISPNSAYIHDVERNRLRDRRRREKEKEVQDIPTIAEQLISEKSTQNDTEKWFTYEGQLPSRDCVGVDISTDTKMRSYLLAKHQSASLNNDFLSTTRMTLHSVDYEHTTDNLVLCFDNSSNSAIWIVDQQVEFLINALSSISKIKGARIETVDSNFEINQIEMIPTPDFAHGKFRLHIDTASQIDIDVKLTPAQWKDLLVSVAALREHSGLAMPETTGSYPRIGPNGNDTWDLGTDVEGRTDRTAFPNNIPWSQ